MSALNPTILHTRFAALEHRVSQINTPIGYAHRIGFIGDAIDRCGHFFLGRVLAQRQFERFATVQCQGEGTALLGGLFRSHVSKNYSGVKHYLLTAHLVGNDLTLRDEQLTQAVDWLVSQKVQTIFYQYNWMYKPEIQDRFKHYLPMELMHGSS
jgi:hypothetical protein